MKKLKFAMVGCGRIAIRHAEYICRFGELYAVCDIRPELAKMFGRKYSCRHYTDFNELLLNEKEIDIVSVCTPNGLHAEHSIKALQSGKHVLCEKPMALSVKDCERMIKEAEEANKRLFIVKQNRFNPPIIALKKVLSENKLGRIFSIQLNCFWNRNEEYYKTSYWRGTKELDGGTLFTQFSHFIDLLYWLFGDIKNINAFTNNYNHKDLIAFEDTGVVVVEFDNGILGTINFTINSFKRNMEGSITLFAEKGTVKIGGQYLNKLEYQNIKDYEIEILDESNAANDYGFYQGSMSNHDKVYENVMDVILNGGIISTNFMDALKTVQIIERIYNSAKANHDRPNVIGIISEKKLDKVFIEDARIFKINEHSS